MKELGIKIGEAYYIKNSARIPRINQPFVVVAKRTSARGNRYYNSQGQYVKANQLTDIPCYDKTCPCH